MVLRLFLCWVSLFFMFGARLFLEDWHRWVLGGFAVLYNPGLPIRIGDKGILEVLNVATVILFWFPSRVRGHRSGPTQPGTRGRYLA